MVAGFLRGDSVELVKGVSVGVEVPARAEIVLEGYIEKDEVGPEGPFGDHTGYYTPAEPFPVFHVTAMTMRRDAIYPSIVVGKPPQEDAWLGKATERIFLPAVRTTLPEIVDTTCRSRAPSTTAASSRSASSSPATRRRSCTRSGGSGCSASRSAWSSSTPRSTCTTTSRCSSTPARTSTRSATSSSRKARSTISTTRRAPVLRRQARHRRDGEVAGGGRAAVARGDRDEPGDQGARHAPLDRVRPALVLAPQRRPLR